MKHSLTCVLWYFLQYVFLRVMAHTLRGIFVIHVWIYISPSERIRLIYQEENDSFLSLWSFSPLTNAIKLCVHFLCEKRKQLNILRNLRLRILYAFACEREWFWMAWSKMLKIKCHYYSGKSYTEVSVFHCGTPFQTLFCNILDPWEIKFQAINYKTPSLLMLCMALVTGVQMSHAY